MTNIFETVPSQEKRLKEPFVWQNTASVENIPGGCAYEQNSRKMHRTLLDCGFPMEADEFEIYLRMSQNTMGEQEKLQVFTRAADFVPIFDQIVKANSSPYGEKVKAWLATLS